jgi:hypothetical protein
MVEKVSGPSAVPWHKCVENLFAIEDLFSALIPGLRKLYRLLFGAGFTGVPGVVDKMVKTV